MLDAKTWYVLDVNPEPWAVGPLSVARGGKGVFPKMGRNQQLYTYQKALSGTLTSQNPNLRPFVDGELSLWEHREVELCFYFWQKQEASTTISSSGKERTTYSKAGDLTNMVKAAEDAVAGILFDNDVQVRAQRNVVVARGREEKLPEGLVVISIEPWGGFDPAELPGGIWEQIEGILGVNREPTLFDA